MYKIVQDFLPLNFDKNRIFSMKLYAVNFNTDLKYHARKKISLTY